MKKQHCVVMDEELSQEIKITAINMGISMSDLISKACVDYLIRRKELIERGLINRTWSYSLDARYVKPTLNAHYGTEAQQYVDTDNPQGV